MISVLDIILLCSYAFFYSNQKECWSIQKIDTQETPTNLPLYSQTKKWADYLLIAISFPLKRISPQKKGYSLA